MRRERRAETRLRRKSIFAPRLSLRPDLRGVHFALGEMYLGSGDYEKAEREFREEARLAPGFAPAAHKLGVVLMNRGETRAAVARVPPRRWAAAGHARDAARTGQGHGCVWRD